MTACFAPFLLSLSVVFAILVQHELTERLFV